uniref:UV-stimulated scaffold protein A n=1 Tax=Gadus morhua TaxID=8049 RepID=A0A8C4YTP2_GADMO
MELAQRDKLSELVEELTTSGQQQLNQEKIKEIKKICRLSKDYVDHVYDSVMAQLDKEHAEIRLSAFQIASELFSRSHQFRIRLVDNFQEFLELTVETDSDQPLPPPKEVAKKLKISAIKTIQSWQAQYGTAYKKLALGYHFMKQVKNVDFNDVQARTVAERSRENERQRRMERIYKDRVETAAKEMEESHQEIETTVTEMKSCLKLLLPDEFGLSDQTAPGPDSRTLGDTAPGGRGLASRQMEEKPSLETFETVELEGREELSMKQEEKEVDRDEEETWMNDVSYEDVFIRNSGLISHSYTLNINVESDVQVKETDDNEAVVSTLIELHRLITTKHLPAVKSWVQVSTHSYSITHSLTHCLAVMLSAPHFFCLQTRATADVEEDDEEEDEDDFEEVPEKEGFEPHIPDHLREEYGESNTHTNTHTITLSEPPSPAVGSAPAGGDGAPDAPIVPFGLDLYYWGEKQPGAGKMIKSTSQHRFWVPSEVDEETENPELLAESSSRYISFPGTFTPVSHHCNALLGNGRLCPRQDRVKCPFHGVIVPRDARGRPSRAEDRAREEREERRHRESHPDWQDVELMQDIEAATGEDLGSKRLLGKGKGKGKGKYPNLSNLKKSANTSRSRLENKVFNKKSVRRVSEVMTKIDSRKHEKFSNQFNYALN